MGEKDEKQWERELKIQTIGRDDSMETAFNHAYEPTSYSVLERLAESQELTKESVLVDYGCGRGRVGLFLARTVGCTCLGVEYDEKTARMAEENRKACPWGNKMTVIRANAAAYEPPVEADSFYFFNPFSLEVLRSVLGKIRDVWYEDYRERKLFFYYPDQEYVAHLMTEPELEFYDEIVCGDLIPGEDSRERILIFIFPGCQ